MKHLVATTLAAALLGLSLGASAQQATPEQRAAMRAKWESMTPEQKAAAKAKWEAKTPEEKAEAKKRFAEHRAQTAQPAGMAEKPAAASAAK